MSSRDQRAARVLLALVLVPFGILVGVLGTAVLGSDGSAARPPASRTMPAVAPAATPLPDEPLVAVAPAPDRATPAGLTPPAVATPQVRATPPDRATAPDRATPQVRATPPVTVAVPAPPPAAEPLPGYAPPGAERVDVGSGPRGAAIFRPSTAAGRPGPVVIFLHGWVAVDPSRYGPWIGHLVRGGAIVIYPAYQSRPAYDTITPLANVLAGVRAALEHVQVAPGRLVVAGHSAGGALAADYAAVATVNGLPAPAAVFSVYPGRKLRHLAVPIPAANLSTIAPGTRVLAYAGERDTAVGTGTATRIVAGAVQADATLRIIRDDAVDDHSAPRRFDDAAQRTFWQPLDELLAATEQHAQTARNASTRLRAAVAP